MHRAASALFAEATVQSLPPRNRYRGGLPTAGTAIRAKWTVTAASEQSAHRQHSNGGAAERPEATPGDGNAAPAYDVAPPSRPHEWPGLIAWRARGRDLRLSWGSAAPDAGGPVALPPDQAPTLESAMALIQQTPSSQPMAAEPTTQPTAALIAAAPAAAGGRESAAAAASAPAAAVALPRSLVEAGLLVLHTSSPAAKAALTHAAWGAYLGGDLPLRPPPTPSPSQGQRYGQLEQLEWQNQDGRQQQQDEARARDQQEQELRLLNGSGAATAAGSGPGSGGPQWKLQDERDQQQLAREQELARRLPEHPARPERPRLVRPKEIPGHESSPLGLNGYMLHNLAHIELNAIDLAWDTVVRFASLNLPDQFYEDFTRVADDEARHLGWCLQRLGELGHVYGDMDAHDLLWQGCRASAGDLGARLAVVPMSQEARGLDAGARLASRLVGFGDSRSAAVVGLIAAEERAHVAVGVTWFTRLCGALGLEPDRLYRRWLLHLNPDLLKGPFNHPERARVGLPRHWYDPTAWPPLDDGESAPTDPSTLAEYKQHGQQQQQQDQAYETASKQQQQHHPAPRRPTRGSPHPRLEGPQPLLTPEQLRLLAERLAVFSGLEGERTATGTAPVGVLEATEAPAPALAAAEPCAASATGPAAASPAAAARVPVLSRG